MASHATHIPPALQTIAPLAQPGHTYESIAREISDVVLVMPTPRAWWACFGVGLLLLSALLGSTVILFWEGLGLWGINNPVGWGFAIINLVLWIGIGHAGTLISPISLLVN